MILVERVHVPLIEHEQVGKRQHGQIAHARMLTHRLAQHDRKRRHVAHGAENDQEQRIVGQVVLVRIVAAIADVFSEILKVSIE